MTQHRTTTKAQTGDTITPRQLLTLSGRPVDIPDRAHLVHLVCR